MQNHLHFYMAINRAEKKFLTFYNEIYIICFT